MPHWSTDADALAEQYADASNLQSRASLHEKFSTSDVDLHEWAFDHLHEFQGHVLALGCGTGAFWQANQYRVPADWEVTLTDFSDGMVREARERLAPAEAAFAFARADAAHLPFAADTFAAITANHMLYHVSDRERALREVARVLRSDGALYAITNGPGHMRELLDAISAVTGESATPATAFTLANGEDQLRQAFTEIGVHRYPDSLRVTAVEPLVEYAMSRPEFGPEDIEPFVAYVEERMDDGVFEITKNTGLFVARP